MSHPYETLPQMAFWRPAVAARDWQDMRDLWQPKFDITAETRIVTFGSCFAQHFSKALQGWGLNWLNAEPAPSIVPEEIASEFGYNIYSARTGNIYTAAGLLQWLDWAFDETAVPDVFWHQDGRVYDPFRPAIEPDGFDDIEQARAARQVTLEALRNGLKQADILVFTLGLTEGWVHSDGHVYPMCPGTVAGQFDANCHSC
ncbi:GSCFA domain-containing protein [Halovulum sp. GXIMD14793]